MGIDLFAGIDVTHASPPCLGYTRKTATWARERKYWVEHPDLVAQVRQMLQASGLPYVIENVTGAPLNANLVLCGTQFGLRIIKHRQFECNFPVTAPEASCDHSDV